MSDPDQNETTTAIVAIVNEGLDEFERSAASFYRRSVTRPAIVPNSVRHDRTAGTVTMTIENVNPAINLEMLIDCATRGLGGAGFGRGVLRTGFEGSELIYVLTVATPVRAPEQSPPPPPATGAPPRRSICGFGCCAKCCIFVAVICSMAIFGLSLYAAMIDEP